MKKNILLIFISLLLVQLVFAEDTWELPEGFKTKLKSGAIFFIEPTMDVDNANMVERRCNSLKVLENKAIEYDFRMQSKIADLEIRYIIHLADSTETVKDDAYKSVLTSISDSITIPLNEMPNEMAKSNLNADWAAISFFTIKEAFKSAFSNYKEGILLSIRNDDKGWIYVIQLFSEYSEEIKKELANPEILNALRFR
ncbi:MAG: hypothetical protein HND52_13700 [Ignavibacteriae bacterium]|nr:hypothetical protein [Ignavibacteriota bacterium]NOG99008.1 hypothetical protein [Ignavibacteriota bacterium]